MLSLWQSLLIRFWFRIHGLSRCISLPLPPKTELITIVVVTGCFLCARRCSDYFVCIQLFNSHNSGRWALLSPFFRCWGVKSQCCLEWGFFFPAGRAWSQLIEAGKDQRGEGTEVAPLCPGHSGVHTLQRGWSRPPAGMCTRWFPLQSLGARIPSTQQCTSQ